MLYTVEQISSKTQKITFNFKPVNALDAFSEN